MFQWFRWTQDYCEIGNYVDGYEMLQGNYGLNNFTSGTPLWLQPFAGLLGCADVEGPTPDSVTFKPLSEANVLSGTYVGSWIGPPEISNATSAYSPFAPGIYTVVASDEWGNVVMLHFTVRD
jgi:hypothetical protein